MAKPKSIYSLKGIFTNLLSDTDKKGFIIPTYQRGYKWSSLDEDGQVNILLRDLFNAYKSKNIRYYLQFLTLKETDEELEVIDGQQRLTTLSIFFCSVFHILQEDEAKNFVIGKLKYQTRQNFIEKFIYENIDKLLEANDWDTFKHSNSEHDNQDVYFIFNAVRTINSFLEENLSEVRSFLQYISENVFLIVNLLDENLNSEKVFVNVNKGVKLNDEDLVKGLLITKLPLDLLNQKYRATEVEINELRTNLGRQWDDLSNWAFRKDIRDFFRFDNKGKNRLDWLIRLTYPEIDEDNTGHAMFSYFDKLYTHDGIAAEDIFKSLRRTKMKLNDWFNEPETCNLLGFLLIAKGTTQSESIWMELSTITTKEKLISTLKAKCLKLLPLNNDLKLRELNYEDSPRSLFNVFLMLDIMKFLPMENRKAKNYDFSNISTENWSLEHIFPQNGKDFKSMDSISTNDLTILKELLNKKVDLGEDQSEEAQHAAVLHAKILKSKDAIPLTDQDKNALILLLKSSAQELHSIGNIALLQSNINSSLSNHFFKRKREILVTKISEGKFVPYHTYDVFSKLIIGNADALHVWTKNDIIAHSDYINNQIDKIVQYLSPTL